MFRARLGSGRLAAIRRGEEGAGQLDDLVGLAQFAHLALRSIDAIPLGSRQTITQTWSTEPDELHLIRLAGLSYFHFDGLALLLYRQM